MNQALTALKTNPEFLQRWQDLEEGKVKILLLEHDWLPINHPRLGQLLFMIWRTTLAADERFNQRDGLHPSAAGVDRIVAGILPKAEQLVARVREKRGS